MTLSLTLAFSPFAAADGLRYLPRLLWAHLERRHRMSRAAFGLRRLADRQLEDIGIAREDIPAIVRRIPLQRPGW